SVVNRSNVGLDRLRTQLEGELATLSPQAHSVSLAYYCSQTSPDWDERVLQQLIAHADAVFCCTPSTQPLFPGSYLTIHDDGRTHGKKRFISMIGSYKPHMQEVDSETLLSGEKNKVLVDSRDACLAEAGELINAGVGAERLVEIGTLPILPPELWQ